MKSSHTIPHNGLTLNFFYFHNDSDNLPYRFFERLADGTERDITDELPFEVPETWEWVRLGNVVNEISTGPFGSMLHKSDYVAGGIPLVNPQNIINSAIYENGKSSVSELTAERLKSYSLNAYDVVIARRGEMGRCAVVEQNQAGWLCGTGCFILRANTNMYSQYITTLIRSRYAIDFLAGNSIGTTMSNLNHGILNKFLVPLPPLAEQHRIVARIEELLLHIEAYNTAEQKLTALNTTFPDQLKKSILQAAVQGKLVPQDPDDEPASILLERIRAERAQLIKDGKLKRSKNESVIFRRDNSHYEKIGDVEQCIDDELPFEIPENWVWVRLGSVVIITGGGTPDKSNTRYWNGNIPWASVKDMKGNQLLGTIDKITAEGLASKNSISVCEPGDLIVATRLVPGKSLVCIVKAAINQDLKRIQSSMDVLYLHYWFSSQLRYFMKLGQGTTVPGIKLEDLEYALLPLPPFAEQKRIVERVDALMPLFARL